MKGIYFQGQSLSEYALVLTLIFAAVFGMQAYMKRGIQGVIKTTADTLSEEAIESGGGSVILPRLEWDEYIKDYLEDYDFAFAEQKGGNIYYYNDVNEKILIGGQDKYIGDFTTFGPDGYPLDTTYYDDDGDIQTQIYTYTYDEEGSINGAVGSVDEKTYGKYAIVTLTSKAVPIVQKGVLEEGLVKLEYTKPLIITSLEGKYVTTDQWTPDPVRIDSADWHVDAYRYFPREGFRTAKEEDEVIYYYHYDSNGENEVLIGAEDKATGDFTAYLDEYPAETLNNRGNIIQLYEYIDGEEAVRGYVVVEGEKIYGETYGKYAVVVLSEPSADYVPAPIDEMKTTTGGGIGTMDDGTEMIEKTEAEGTWEFTYEMGDAGSFSASDKKDRDTMSAE